MSSLPTPAARFPIGLTETSLPTAPPFRNAGISCFLCEGRHCPSLHLELPGLERTSLTLTTDQVHYLEGEKDTSPRTPDALFLPPYCPAKGRPFLKASDAWSTGSSCSGYRACDDRCAWAKEYGLSNSIAEQLADYPKKHIYQGRDGNKNCVCSVTPSDVAMLDLVVTAPLKHWRKFDRPPRGTRTWGEWMERLRSKGTLGSEDLDLAVRDRVIQRKRLAAQETGRTG